MQSIEGLDLSTIPLPDDIDLGGFSSLKKLIIGEISGGNINNWVFPESLQEMVCHDEPHPVTRVYCSLSGNADFDKAVQSLSFREPDMVTVEQGTFWLGSKPGAANALLHEFPRHKVSLSEFAIGRQPVTVAEFACFVAETGYVTTAEQEGWSISILTVSKGGGVSRVDQLQLGCNWRYNEYGLLRINDLSCYPVVHISWDDATAYCAWLTQKTGRSYKLPTEAQWEYAAMGGHRAPKDEGAIHYAPYVYSGSDNLAEVGIFADNSVGIAPFVDRSTADSRSPNQLGIQDMSGNVWEWFEDFYHPSFYQKDSASEVNPTCTDPVSSARVVRGGSWLSPERNCRLAFRNGRVPELRSRALGFRRCAVL
jgi:formylglycine-generating enzyme required for sulfatase activity